MHSPPLPRQLSDLHSWHVHADHLLEGGEAALGEFIAHDLTLSSPTKPELRAFHERAKHVCRLSRELEVGWLLGYAKTLTVTARNPRVRMSRSTELPSMTDHALVQLKALLARPALSMLEQVSLSLSRPPHPPLIGVLAALPPTCHTVEIAANGFSNDAHTLLGLLPPQVEVLRPFTRYGADLSNFIGDSVRWVDLRLAPLHSKNIDLLERALQAHPSVQVRLGDVSDARLLERLAGRCTVGGPDDAALIDEASGAVVIIERAPLEALQRRFGVIAARAQLTRSLPEWFDVSESPTGVHCRSFGGSALLRRGDGSWWVRNEPQEWARAPMLALEGEPLGTGPAVPLVEGARLQVGVRRFRFRTSVELQKV